MTEKRIFAPDNLTTEMQENDENFRQTGYDETRLRKLLLKCAVTDGEIFLKTFVEWEKQVVYERLGFQSFRVLSVVYPKLIEHKLQSSLMLRIQGSYRRTWTENQLLLSRLEILLAALNTAQLEFIIADEALRLTKIHNDVGIFSLQNFSLSAPYSRKKEICRTLIENLWQIDGEEIEKTGFISDKVLRIQFFWVTDKDFAAQIKNAEMFSVKDNLQPMLAAEEQILNLCAREFSAFGEQESRWQLLVCEFFKAQKLDHDKLIEIARQRHLAAQLAEMLQKLSDAFDLEVPARLFSELEKIKKTSRLFIFRRKINSLKENYRMYLKYENGAGAKIGFFEFLAHRWTTESNADFIKHLVRSSRRLWQTK